MTATRGRVLIINVRDAPDREGSQYDYKNLEEMFGKLGFIVSNLSDDKAWTAQVTIDIQTCTYYSRLKRNSDDRTLQVLNPV